MAEVKWIKIVTDIFDDEKILLVETLPEADSIIVIWFKLLCLAGKTNNSGVFIFNGMPYTDSMLSTIFRRKESTVKLALKTFEQFGMVEIINDTITIPNWGKHQNLDQLEAKKEYMRDYMASYREKQKAITDGKSNCKTNSKTNVSSLDKIRVEEDKEGDISTGARRKRFAPPSIQEVMAYCQERNKGVNPQKWIDHYTSNGWKVGRNQMKDWKAAVRKWEPDEPKGNKSFAELAAEMEARSDA